MQANPVSKKTTYRFPWVVCMAATPLIGLSVVEGQSTAPPPLLIEPAGVVESGAAVVPTVFRRRRMDVDFNLLEQVKPGDTLTFNLFDDASFVGVFERQVTRGADSYTWFGSLDGMPASRFVLTREKNVALATVEIFGDATYRLRCLADGVHVVEELDAT